MSVMLYKLGTQMNWHGVYYDTIVVEEDDVEPKLKEGWFKNALDCKEENLSLGDEDLDGEVTRKEMETKARELGIPFNKRTKDKDLLAKIEEKLDELD